jgi:hypothetical protein
MRIFITASLVIAILAACAQSQLPANPIGPEAALSASQRLAATKGSWMTPEAKTSDLLYVAASGSVVYALTYPQGKIVGELTGFPGNPQYLCIGKGGHLFVTIPGGGSNISQVYEFPHGGSRPIAKLTDPGNAQGCSVDITTGDLAIANLHSNFGRIHYGTIVIFRKARGSPKVYRTGKIGEFQFCTYDGQGNLLADGGDRKFRFALVMLPRAAHQFQQITLNKPTRRLGPIQWDGTNFALGYAGTRALYQIAISGSAATVVKTIRLHSLRRNGLVEQFWVQGSTIIGILAETSGHLEHLGFWPYPGGGTHTKILRQVGSEQYMTGVAVSIASSR